MKDKRYGLPYKGSKNKIADWVVEQLPPAGHFYDLFCGGCAVTHAAMAHGKYRYYHANDILADVPQLFYDACNGKYRNERRWISREGFFALKDTDAHVRLCWSFGNNQQEYMYSREIEPWKKALHYARVFGDTSLLREFGIESDGSRQDIVQHHAEYKEKYMKWYIANVWYKADEYERLVRNLKERIRQTEDELRNYLLEALKKSGLTQREVGKRIGTQMEGHYFGCSQWAFPTKEYYIKMQEFMPLTKDYDDIVGIYELQKAVQSLQSLQSLESLQRLQTTSKDYAEIDILPNSTVYCDIPYEGTSGYGLDGKDDNFNHARFYEWALSRDFPVFVSSYSLPDDFALIAVTAKSALMNGKGSGRKMSEGIYVQKKFANIYKRDLFL